MKTQSTFIALAVFALLAIAYVATREPQVSVGIRKLTLVPVSADALTLVELGPTRLTLENGKWLVASSSAPEKKYATDPALVKNLRQTLADLRAPDFVTDQADKHAEYEVDAAKGLLVKASTGTGVVRELLVGKTSKSGGAYLRDAKSNEVFVTTGSLAYEARRPVSGWRNKTITSLRADDVTSLVVTLAGAEPFTLVAEGTAWKLQTLPPKDFHFEPSAALRLLSQFSSLTAQDFAEGEPTEALLATHVATMKDGTTVSLKVFAARADGTHPMRLEGDAQTYLVAQYQADPLTRGLDGLRDLRVLHFEPGQVEKLTIKVGDQKTVVSKSGESWKVLEPKTLPAGLDFEPQQVTSALVRLSTLRAARVVSDTAEAKAGLGATEVEVALTGGKKQALRIGNANGSEFVAKGDEALLFGLSGGDKAFFERGVELFRRPPPPPQGGMQTLDQLPPEIRAQIEAQLRQQQGR